MPLSKSHTLAERFRDAFIYGIVLVVLIFSAGAVLNASQSELVVKVESNTRKAAEQVAAIRQLIQAQTCILALPIDDRTKPAVNGCLNAAGVGD